MAKCIIQRQLPLQHYHLVNAYHDKEGDNCQNCSRHITYVGIVQAPDGSEFRVGLDCAQTLQGIEINEVQKTQKYFRTMADLLSAIKKYEQSKEPNGYYRYIKAAHSHTANYLDLTIKWGHFYQINRIICREQWGLYFSLAIKLQEHNLQLPEGWSWPENRAPSKAEPVQAKIEWP